jgi:CheY-like chemotaxis protein
MPRIMIVDDDSDIREVACQALGAAGHEVIEAKSGLDCLSKLKSEVNPDLIFLDIMMPIMDGWEVCRRIRANEALSKIKVCMFTVRDSAEDLSKSLEKIGAEWHLTKPVSIKKLLETVDFLLTLDDSAYFDNFANDFYTVNKV